MAIIEIQQFFHCKAKQVFHAHFSKIGRLRRVLRSLQHWQERRPYSSYISSRVIKPGTRVLKLGKASIDFTYHNRSSKWAKSGDKVNKMFFVVHTHHKLTNRISSLKCPHGSYATDPS